LQPHWHRLLVEKFGAASCLGDSHSGSSGDGDGSIAGGDGAWRAAYDAKERERAEKEQRIREKCQRMFEQERTAKQQRCTQVRVPPVTTCCHLDCIVTPAQPRGHMGTAEASLPCALA